MSYRQDQNWLKGPGWSLSQIARRFIWIPNVFALFGFKTARMGIVYDISQVIVGEMGKQSRPIHNLWAARQMPVARWTVCQGCEICPEQIEVRQVFWDQTGPDFF